MSPFALSVRFLQTQPDSKLVELSRAGHERAFEALVQRYRRPLLKYCRRLSGSDAAAEDALQQGLLQAWIAIGNGEVEVREARAWLYRIVHNVAVSSLRRPVHTAVDVDRRDGAGGADDEVERRLAARQALAGIASLPEPQRQVMLSTALEGRSHDEVAATLGLSHGAVRGLIYRARATLRAAAAALTPGLLIHWAARHDVGAGGRSASIYEAIAGGGSAAGLGGVLIKGGALVMTAGALATATGTGITTRGDHPQGHSFHHRASGGARGPAHSGGAPVVGVAAEKVRDAELTALTGAVIPSPGSSEHHGRRGRSRGEGGGPNAGAPGGSSSGGDGAEHGHGRAVPHVSSPTDTTATSSSQVSGDRHDGGSGPGSGGGDGGRATPTAAATGSDGGKSGSSSGR